MKNIKSLSYKEIESVLKENNEKGYRAKQIYDWLWKFNVSQFSQMKNIPKNTIDFLNSNYSINSISTIKSIRSTDGTIKLAFSLFDGHIIEGVLIPSDDRTTACISTQAGCMAACIFCATGKMGFKRNLLSHEIFEQVFIINELSIKEYGHKLNNIVLMGMGEPLLNYEEVIDSIEKITNNSLLAFSPQRITLSTVGISEKIKQLADDNLKFNLAVSLHTANHQKRDKLIPLNRVHNLEKISESLIYYHKKTGNRITIEYLMIRNFNDKAEDAKELALFCKSFPVKVNIIEYNSTDNKDLIKPERKRLLEFCDFLESKNMIVNIRKSKGADINAACGQLSNKFLKP